MAEVFGVVASGVALAQLAVKVGRETIALRQLWDDIKDVPQSIKALTEDIALLEPLLQEMEAVLGDSGDNNTTTPIAKYCRAALSSLTESVQELSAEVGGRGRFKRGAARVRVSLRKDFWLKHEARLQRVAQLLGLAIQWYQTELMRKQPQRLISQLESSGLVLQCRSTHLTPHRKETTETQTICNKEQEKRMTRNPEWIRPSVFGNLVVHSASTTSSGQVGEKGYIPTSAQHSIQIRPPSWISRRAWDILATNSYSGFKFHLRSYCIVPIDAEVFKLARKGHLREVIDLFDRGLASPFDVTKDGQTILQASISSGNVQLLTKSIEWGLDLGEAFDPIRKVSLPTFGRLDDVQIRTAYVLALHGIALSKSSYEEAEDRWHSHVDHTTSTQMDTMYQWMQFHLTESVELLRAMLLHLQPGHYELPLENRLWFLYLQGWAVDPDSLLVALRPDGKLRESDVQYLADANLPLITLMASRYRKEAFKVMHQCGGHDSSVPARESRWRQVSRDVMEATEELHIRSFSSAFHGAELGISWTALSSVINDSTWATVSDPGAQKGYKFYGRDFRSWRRCTETALRYWLEDLEMCGVDLEAYGERERNILFRSKVRAFQCPAKGSEHCWVTLTSDNVVERVWKLEDFEYGPSPRDWKFYWILGSGLYEDRNFSLEDYAQQFWEVVESPWLSMVGAWVE